MSAGLQPHRIVCSVLCGSPLVPCSWTHAARPCLHACLSTAAAWGQPATSPPQVDLVTQNSMQKISRHALRAASEQRGLAAPLPWRVALPGADVSAFSISTFWIASRQRGYKGGLFEVCLLAILLVAPKGRLADLSSQERAAVQLGRCQDCGFETLSCCAHPKRKQNSDLRHLHDHDVAQAGNCSAFEELHCSLVR